MAMCLNGSLHASRWAGTLSKYMFGFVGHRDTSSEGYAFAPLHYEAAFWQLMDGSCTTQLLELVKSFGIEDCFGVDA
eukprot:4105429-Amphidinium_carterae.1